MTMDRLRNTMIRLIRLETLRRRENGEDVTALAVAEKYPAWIRLDDETERMLSASESRGPSPMQTVVA